MILLAYKIAVVDFGKAIALRPNRPENYYFRGSCHSKLGNFERVYIYIYFCFKRTIFMNIID